jgi:hypothetical protein
MNRVWLEVLTEVTKSGYQSWLIELKFNPTPDKKMNQKASYLTCLGKLKKENLRNTVYWKHN